MKNSIYNHITSLNDDEHIIYNIRTMGLGIIDRDSYNEYKKLLNKELVEDKNFMKNLYENGFLIDDDINELDFIKTNMFRSRYISNVLSLTIAPTMSCNFGCKYCFETNKEPGYMSDEIMECLIKYIKKELRIGQALQITWFGGEPLLAFENIKYLTKKFLEICEDKDCKYIASIVTNGYMLDNQVLSEFENLLIKEVQVTIDGERSEHDKRRPLKSGARTYDRIITNLEHIKKHQVKVSVRINVDRNNENSTINLLKDLYNIGLKDISIGLGRVEPYNNCCDDKICYNIEEFSEEEIKFINLMINEGFGDRYVLPTRKSSYCTADNINAYVIDSKGYIYKCWSEIGIKENAIGNIIKPENINYKKFFDYMIYDPTEDVECRNCKLLPICLGGCPNRRLGGVERCNTIKYNIDEIIKKSYLKDVVNN